MSSTVGYWLNGAVMIMIWLVVLCRGWAAAATVTTEVWWSCVLLAVYATLRFTANAEVFDQLTGGVGLSIPVTHLLLVIALLLTVQWLLLARDGAEANWLPKTGIGIFIATAGLTGTWLASPSYERPVPGTPTSAVVAGAGGALTAHWLLFYLLVLLPATIIGLGSIRQARELRGRMRLGILAMSLAGWMSTGYALDGLLIQLGILAGESRAALPAIAGPTAILAVFALAEILPLGSQPPQPPDQTQTALAGMLSWLSPDSPRTHGGNGAPPSEVDTMAIWLTIRDKMLILQRWVTSETKDRAEQAAGRAGLTGTARDAYVTARCLTEALRARERGLPAVGEVSLAQLGRGETLDTLDLEIGWLAAIWKAADSPDPDSHRAGSGLPRAAPQLRRRGRRSQVWLRRTPLRLIYDDTEGW